MKASEGKLQVGQRSDAEDWRGAWKQAAGIWADYPDIEARIAEGRVSWRRRREALLGKRGR